MTRTTKTNNPAADANKAAPKAAQKRPVHPSRREKDEVTIQNARLLCPHHGQAENVAAAFVLCLPDFDAIGDIHATLLRDTAKAFGPAFNEVAAKIHFQRLAGTYVASAVAAGRFYSDKVLDARRLTSEFAHEDGKDQEAPYGFESRAEKARKFAADLAMQSYAILAAAEGAISAYAEITGEDWKPYKQPQEPQNVARKSAAAELDAFGH